MEEKRCIKCGSTLTYVRIKNRERICRGCGHVEPLYFSEDLKKEPTRELRPKRKS